MLSFRLNPRRKPLMYIILAFIIILLWRWLRTDDIDWDIVGNEEPGKIMRDPELRLEKWIIVTTIQHPTPSMKKLAEIPGWKLLVVGDRRTPKTWSLPGAIFLDVKSQKALGYQVHAYLPYDSYTRKVIGYLYAIEHGAQYIYETDDDNFPEGDLEQFMVSMGRSELLLLQTKNLTYNPLVHFGQSTMWPRGYPLDHIGLSSDREYKLCNLHVPAIQQGLVNGDPDVDALFRLTRKHANEELNIKFDTAAPPVVLPKGTFAPMNSQNTLYTGKAFWALILPVSVQVRACDIYRSYWAQTLLWMLGGNVGFYAPTSFQKRNPHSHLMDAVDETELYHYMGAFIKYLKKWSCNKMFFFDCVSQLTHDLVEAGFLKRRDADLVDAWITDLATVAYVPPAMRSEDPCSSSSTAFVASFYPDEQVTTLPQSTDRHLPRDAVNHVAVEGFVSQVCGHSHVPHWHSTRNKAHKFTKDLLVISIHSSPSEVIPALEAAYRPYFPHIIYCGEKQASSKFFHQWKVTYITPSNNHISGVSCVHAVTKLRYNVEAYIHVTETIFLNIMGEKLHNKQENLMWVTGELDAYRPETVALCKDTINCIPITKDVIGQLNRFTNELEAGQKFKSTIKECFAKLGSDPSFQAQPQLQWVTDMTFRLPLRSQDKFLELAGLYLRNSDKRKYDFSTLLLMECLEHTVEYMAYGDVGDPNRSDDKTDYLFPYQFKLTQSDNGALKGHYCTHFEKYK